MEWLERAMPQLMELLLEEDGREFFRKLGRYWAEAGRSMSRSTFKELLGRIKEETIRSEIMSLADVLIEEGRQEGLEKGVQQGRVEGMDAAGRQSVLDAVEARFEVVPNELVERVNGLSGQAVLRRALREAIAARSLEEFALRM